MTYYDSPNDYPAFGLTGQFFWTVTDSIYNSVTDKTAVEIDFGYENEIHQETREVDGNPSNVYDAVIAQLAEYINSAGPVTGGGFPIKKI